MAPAAATCAEVDCSKTHGFAWLHGYVAGRGLQPCPRILRVLAGLLSACKAEIFVSKNQGTFYGVPTIRTLVFVCYFWDLYRTPAYLWKLSNAWREQFRQTFCVALFSAGMSDDTPSALCTCKHVFWFRSASNPKHVGICARKLSSMTTPSIRAELGSVCQDV